MGMKRTGFTSVIVLTADQRRSRAGPDRVPEALDALSDLSRRARCAFERTAGDEIQGVLADGTSALAGVVTLARLGDWRIGLGIGTAETPLPRSTRAARGAAFVAARTAVEDARRSPVQLAVRGSAGDEAPVSRGVAPPPRGGDPRDAGQPRITGQGGVVGPRGYVDLDATTAAESALWLLLSVLDRRTPQGWEVVDLMQHPTTGQAVAARLGITPSAVSQRLSRAAFEETRRGEVLAASLLDLALSRVTS